MAAYNIYEAKTHLSALLDKARDGEEVIIAKAGKPIAKLIPVQEPAQQRKPRQFGPKFLGIKILSPDWEKDVPLEMFDVFNEENHLAAISGGHEHSGLAGGSPETGASKSVERIVKPGKSTVRKRRLPVGA